MKKIVIRQEARYSGALWEAEAGELYSNPAWETWQDLVPVSKKIQKSWGSV